MPPSLAAAAATRPSENSSERMILFMGSSPEASVGGVGHAVGYGLELAHAAPQRHQQEEREVQQGPDLRHAVAGGRRRLRAEVAEPEADVHEHAADVLVPAGAVEDR